MKALKSFSYLYCQTTTQYPKSQKRIQITEKTKSPDLKKPEVVINPIVENQTLVTLKAIKILNRP
jgi:hypothetical protein